MEEIGSNEKNIKIEQDKKILYFEIFFCIKIIIKGKIDKYTKGYVIDLIEVEKPKNSLNE